MKVNYTLFADNLETPKIFIPLNNSFADTIAQTTKTAPTISVPQSDRYGYPLIAAYFSSTNRGTLVYTTAIEISEDFTLCFHVKYNGMIEDRLFKLSNPDGKLKVSLHNGGEISFT